jgi:hypothetical protein
LLCAISSLPCLTDLIINGTDKVFIPATFPRSLRRLKVMAFRGGDVSELFDAGPHNQIRELMVYGTNEGVQTAVRACPEITAISVDAHCISQGDLDSILGMCKSLQRLCIDGRMHDDVWFSFASLESSPCARSLTSIKSRAKLTPGFMEIICRCCPAIEELSVCIVGPADVRAMASLMRLHVLEVNYISDWKRGSEFSEAFTALGNADGATPFTRLVLRFAKFDVMGFFSSRRCSALRKLELVRCIEFTEQAMRTLAINVRDSLVVLSSSSAVLISPLLAECRCLERLILRSGGLDVETVWIIGQTCKAPLRWVEINSKMSDDNIRAVVPALAGVVFLDIDCSTKAVLQHIIPRCPCLQVLRAHSFDVKTLRSGVPKHITVLT